MANPMTPLDPLAESRLQEARELSDFIGQHVLNSGVWLNTEEYERLYIEAIDIWLTTRDALRDQQAKAEALEEAVKLIATDNNGHVGAVQIAFHTGMERAERLLARRAASLRKQEDTNNA